MTPKQALKILNDLVEMMKLTGPDRDIVRRAVDTLQDTLPPEVQEKDATS